MPFPIQHVFLWRVVFCPGVCIEVGPTGIRVCHFAAQYCNTFWVHTAYRPSRASLKRLTSVKAHGPTCHIGRTAVLRTGEQYTKSTETDSDTSRYKLELFLTTLPLVQTASGHQLGSVTSVCPSHRHRQKMPGAWMGWMGWCSSAGCGVCAGHYTVHDMRCTM